MVIFRLTYTEYHIFEQTLHQFMMYFVNGIHKDVLLSELQYAKRKWNIIMKNLKLVLRKKLTILELKFIKVTWNYIFLIDSYLEQFNTMSNQHPIQTELDAYFFVKQILHTHKEVLTFIEDRIINPNFQTRPLVCS